MSFLVFTALAAALQPFWPVIVNAIQRGDCAWIKRAAAWTFGLTIAAWSVAAVCTLALGEAIIGIWLGSAEFATPGMMLALCVQMLGLAVMAWGLVLLGALAMQAWHLIALLASALVYLIASATMSETFGAEGVLMAQGIALTTLFTPLAVYAVWRRIGVLEHGAARAAQAAA
jgi:hypothetical protein